MSLRANPGVEYPGAGTLVYPPCAEDCCCARPGLQNIVRYYGSNGVGSIVKGGVGRIQQTLAEVVTMCEGAGGVITAYNWLSRRADGSGFGEETGLARCEVDVGAGWEVRETTNWFDTHITVEGTPLGAGSLLRFRTTCGAYSNTWVVALLLDMNGDEVTSWPWPVPLAES